MTKRWRGEKGRKINYRTIKKMRVFTFAARHLYIALLMLMVLHLMICHLVDELEAASVLMCRETFKTAKASSTWSASIIGWKSAYSTEMSFWKLCWWRHCCCIVWSVRIHLSILFEKLLKCFSIFNTIIVGTSWFFSLSCTPWRLKIVVEFWYLFWHDQICVRIVMVIVLFQRLECLFCPSPTRHFIKHSFLISVFYSTRFTCCHRFRL